MPETIYFECLPSFDVAALALLDKAATVGNAIILRRHERNETLHFNTSMIPHSFQENEVSVLNRKQWYHMVNTPQRMKTYTNG